MIYRICYIRPMKKEMMTKKYTPYDEVRAKWMKDPEFKKAYDESRFEFSLITAMVRERMKHNLTQKQLAERVGLTQSAIARFERGRSNPTLSFLKKLAGGLGLTLIAKG